jgi:hypothetical protein
VEHEEPDDVPSPPRFPHIGECDLCGSAPAEDVKFARVTGMVIVWRWARFEAELCRTCAIGAFRDAQAHNLMAGWWGIIAPIANTVALLMNWARRASVMAWPAPRGRDPAVMAPLQRPIASVPVPSRPGAWFGGLAFAGIVLLLVVPIAGSGTADTAPSPTGDSVIGLCLTNEGFEVSCTSAEAEWEITHRGQSCPAPLARFTDETIDVSYCAAPR